MGEGHPIGNGGMRRRPMRSHPSAARTLLAAALIAAGAAAAHAGDAQRPNVLLIMTDDQGYGDLGAHGNTIIRTPHLDSLARESVVLNHFYVSPVCAPTRASLMTGRYNYRTGAVDTYIGRAMMDPAEITLAEMLRDAGYRTGIFGKWHLGDNYPMRPIDQGFDEALVHRGGGIGQPADPPDNSYFDPVLQYNGREERRIGYCSDIFTGAAIDYVSAPADRPFFAYLAFNCPHTPLQVPDAYAAPYRALDPASAGPPGLGHPLPGAPDPETTARVYGMVTNIDENLGRLFAALAQAGRAENTIVIFLTDNGPQQVRYTAGLRGRKGSVYEGGICVPCFVRWPAGLPGARAIATPAAHIDLAPTILEACGVTPPASVAFDGRSLLPLLRGAPAQWPERTLFFQWHRGDVPQLGRACAARGARYKLVQALGTEERAEVPAPRFELFDLIADPFEMRDLAADQPQIVAAMRAEYEAWFRDVSATRGYAPPRIVLGSAHENPVILTRQDWRGPRAGWAAESLGYWEVETARAGMYHITLRVPAAAAATPVRLTVGDVALAGEALAGATAHAFTAVRLDAGPARLEAALGPEGAAARGPHYVDVERVD